MNRFRWFVAGIFLTVTAGVIAQSTGGFPSRPKFQDVRIRSTGFIDNGTTDGLGLEALGANPIEFSTNGTVRASVSSGGVLVAGSVNGHPGNIEIQAPTASDPILSMTRDSSGVGVGIGRLRWYGKDSVGNYENYALLQGEINVNTNGSESGALIIQTMSGGSLGTRVRLAGEALTINSVRIPRTAYGAMFCSGLGAGAACTNSTFDGQNITCEHSGAGINTCEITGFSGRPICTATGISNTTPITPIIVVNSTTSIEVELYDHAGNLSDQNFYIHCVGN